jgi:hypothetical protein
VAAYYNGVPKNDSLPSRRICDVHLLYIIFLNQPLDL